LTATNSPPPPPSSDTATPDPTTAPQRPHRAPTRTPDPKQRSPGVPIIAIPLGPEGGAGFLEDGVADAATIADRKGRHMGMDRLTALFDAAPPVAAEPA
jgi:hypothetical protein